MTSGRTGCRPGPTGSSLAPPGTSPGSGAAAFFPEVAVTFTVDGDGQHYHVPLLLSPFGYTTYRGS